MEESEDLGLVLRRGVPVRKAAPATTAAATVKTAAVAARGKLGRDANVYHAAKLAFGGLQQTLKSGNNERVGVSTFTDTRLGVGQHLKVKGLRVMWGSALAAVASAANVVFGNNTQSFAGQNIPAALLNADIEITRNSEVIISVPMSDFIVPGEVTTSGHARMGTVLLSSEKAFGPQDNIGINIRFPEDGTAPADLATNGYWFKVRFIGTESNTANA